MYNDDNILISDSEFTILIVYLLLKGFLIIRKKENGKKILL